MTSSSVLYVDPNAWYQDRLLSFRPKHFVLVATQPTSESLQWIVHKLSGRYCLEHTSLFDSVELSFEDPKEAIFYELTWS